MRVTRTRGRQAMRARVTRQCWCDETATHYTPTNHATSSRAHLTCDAHVTHEAVRMPSHVDVELPAYGVDVVAMHVTWAEGMAEGRPEWHAETVLLPSALYYGTDAGERMAEAASGATSVAEVLLFRHSYVSTFYGGEEGRTVTAEAIDEAEAGR